MKKQPLNGSVSDQSILQSAKASQNFKRDADLARALGVSRQAVSRWMRGLARPSDLWLIQVSSNGHPEWMKKMAQDLIKVHALKPGTGTREKGS